MPVCYAVPFFSKDSREGSTINNCRLRDVDGESLLDIETIIDVVVKDSNEMTVSRPDIVRLVSCLVDGELLKGRDELKRHFVEHERCANKFGLQETMVSALEGYVWAHMWPMRLSRIIQESMIEPGVQLDAPREVLSLV